jgi:hypothetical protein
VPRDQAQPSREVPGRRRRPHKVLALGDEDAVGTIAIDFHHSPAGLLRCFSNLREESNAGKPHGRACSAKAKMAELPDPAQGSDATPISLSRVEIAGDVDHGVRCAPMPGAVLTRHAFDRPDLRRRADSCTSARVAR